MKETALRVENLEIVYMPYHNMRIRNLLGRKEAKLMPIHAIKGLTFSVEKGEILGIVGRNGSGKTTLLRAIAGVFSPDGGSIDLCGNRVSLMALGVGFDPELSGRENIVLSGMMLGFSRREVKEGMENIIAFSELHDFIDYPVRTYSSGMYARLAFSITTFLSTDIMLIDEVLSVGDISFQEKSRRKMKELIEERRHTVLMVSHDINMLKRISDRVLWLEGGRLKEIGEKIHILNAYWEKLLLEKNTGADDRIYIYGAKAGKWQELLETIPAIAKSNIVHLEEDGSPKADKENITAIPLRKWLGGLLKDPSVEIQPVRIRLEACTLCQLNCADCYMRKEDSGTVGRGYLKLKDFRQFLMENPRIREIELSNSGEVFLNPDLINILKAAWEQKIVITMGNGVNLNTASDEQLEALVKYQVHFINVSIDGATQEVYEIYRRKGNLARVLKNIGRINHFKEKYHSEFPLLQWQFVVFEHNEKEIPEAKKMAEGLGMRFFLKEDWGGYRRSKDVHCGTAVKNKDKPEDQIAEDECAINQHCAQMLFSPQINWDGRLLGCCRVFKEDWGVNVFDCHSLERALGKEEYRRALLCHLGEAEDTDGDTPCCKCDSRFSLMI